jgi:DNA-binding IclR family transcriptional regulator
MSSPVDRSLDLLEVLAAEPAGLPLGRICEQTGLSKSVGHRLLNVLVRRDYVRHDGNGHYALTMRLTSLGLQYLGSTHITDVCQPVLERLARETGELVRMTVAEEQRLIWVAKAQGARSGLRYDGETGGEPELYCTATGHIWLAAHSDEEALRLVYAQGWPPPRDNRPRAPRTVEELLARFASARRQGYATVTDSGMHGMAAVAAAIRRVTGTPAVVGTLSVAGPSVRLSAGRMREVAKLVVAAAQELGRLWPVRLYQQGALAADAAAVDRAS